MYWVQVLGMTDKKLHRLTGTMCRFDSQSERLHKLMETRDEEAGSLRADVAAAREELHQARTTLADTSAKDKAERLEAEVSEIRVSLKEKDASINQACSSYPLLFLLSP